MSTPIPRPAPPPSRPVPGPPPPPAAAGTAHGGQFGAGDQDTAATVAGLRDSVADLDQLDDLPVADHVARYDALHGTLSEALAAIDGV